MSRGALWIVGFRVDGGVLRRGKAVDSSHSEDWGLSDGLGQTIPTIPLARATTNALPPRAAAFAAGLGSA